MLQEEVQRKAHSPSPIGQEPSISARQPHRCRTEDMRTSENFLKAKFAERTTGEVRRIHLPRTPGNLGIGEEGPGKRLGTRPDLPEPALPRALHAADDVGAVREVGGVCVSGSRRVDRCKHDSDLYEQSS